MRLRTGTRIGAPCTSGGQLKAGAFASTCVWRPGSWALGLVAAAQRARSRPWQPARLRIRRMAARVGMRMQVGRRWASKARPFRLGRRWRRCSDNLYRTGRLDTLPAIYPGVCLTAPLFTCMAGDNVQCTTDPVRCSLSANIRKSTLGMSPICSSPTTTTASVADAPSTGDGRLDPVVRGG
ncbi:hypothetical protein BCR44DRAFT_1435200 [Catenaria anguillulae PL171]|uniref:Uncharacterized protein n=1 Tax=Catenaria anguillulae PL171 TaxID=765915 RepID=A0A1Y2HKR7_9FUNG|nr:hypothetical protein BCR44DRAFT_1435200 [Catenaria anguillulae PL171]